VALLEVMWRFCRGDVFFNVALLGGMVWRFWRGDVFNVALLGGIFQNYDGTGCNKLDPIVVVGRLRWQY